MTVIAVLKKSAALRHINPALLPPPRSRAVRALQKHAAEVDEMRSFVSAQEKARWLWHAIDHHTGKVLAYVVGTRKDVVFFKLQALLALSGIIHYYTAKAGVDQHPLPPEQHTRGKLSMQKIEREHLTLRPRLKRFARKSLFFSARSSCMTYSLGYIGTTGNSAALPKKEQILNWNTPSTVSHKYVSRSGSQ